MARSYPQLQQNLKFDQLMRFLDREFQPIPDHRASNARYSLADVLKSAFAMFSLKCPSLLDFTQQTIPEQSNMRSIYRIDGAIPCDNQMRGILDPVDPAHLRPLFRALFLRLRQAGIVRHYQYWQQYAIVSVDGVEHFSSTKIHCPSCSTRTHRNGVVSYHHAAWRPSCSTLTSWAGVSPTKKEGESGGDNVTSARKQLNIQALPKSGEKCTNGAGQKTHQRRRKDVDKTGFLRCSRI